MKYKILEIIAEGNMAIIYKIKIKDNIYALRKEQILKKDVKLFKNNNKEITHNLLDRKIWRSIYFATTMNIYDNYFMKLYKYKIISNCDFIHTYRYTTEYIDKLAKSKYCIESIYDLKESCLHDIIYTIPDNKIYSFIIQIRYALYLMSKHGFYHQDIHYRNICYKKTHIEFLYLPEFKLNIPTFGYIYSIIDYDDIYSDKFKLTKSEKKLTYDQLQYKYNSPCLRLLLCLYPGLPHSEGSQCDNKFKPSYNDQITFLNNTNEIYILKKMFPNVTGDYLLDLIKIFYPLKYLESIGINKNHRLYDQFIIKRIDVIDAYYYVYNIQNVELLLLFFLKKIYII